MSLERIIQEIHKRERFLVTTHVNPEGDAIGSALAMGLALRAFGKKVSLILRDPIPTRLRFLPESHLFQKVSDFGTELPAFDAMIVVDCGDLERVGFVKPDRPPAPVIINVDHHVSNVGFGQINWILPDATASGVLVFQIIQALGIPMNAAMATALYTTLVTETGAFRYSNTTPETFHLAGDLTRWGADPCRIAEEIYSANSVGRLKLLARLLNSMGINAEGTAAWLLVPESLYEETQSTAEDTEDFINFPRSLTGVEVAFLLRETPEPGIVKASMRSNGRVDVSRLAMQFGGGGHKKAAGFSMKGNLEEVRVAALKAVEAAISEARKRTA